MASGAPARARAAPGRGDRLTIRIGYFDETLAPTRRSRLDQTRAAAQHGNAAVSKRARKPRRRRAASARRPRLTAGRILAWADAHRAAMGAWPSKRSGRVRQARGEDWMAIDTALQRGLRGLWGGTTLVRLLSRRRGARDRRNPPRLTIGRILAWADAHRRRSGEWPTMLSGPVHEDRGETWGAINDALFRGSRSLRGGSSIARLLAKHRGRRHKHESQRLTVARILAWADAHRRRAGDWPSKLSGPVRDAPGETWSGIDDALKRGGRGLPGGSSLPKLLAARRGRRHVRYQPPVTGAQILAWADAHYRRHGDWPSANSGPVHGAPGENWASIDKALEYGRRGLPGGTTLPRFLARHRGRPYQSKGPPLTEARIVRWAGAHRARTGGWPTPASGAVAGVRGKRWQKVNHALSAGLRGLSGGTTLLKLLADRCGARHPRFPPRLNEKQILAWADAHRRRTGDWPEPTSGPVAGAPGETWSAIQGGLASGGRGLRGGSSIPRLLALHRGRRHKHEAPRLTQQQVLAWADAHRARTGDWPAARSGPVAHAAGETWSGVNSALTRGQRGLKGGLTLVGLLARHRGRRDRLNPPRLTQQQILAWADAFYARTGDWPSRHSGRLEEDRHERWSALNAALVKGIRGLRGGSSLVKLLSAHRRVLYRRKGLPLARSDILEWAAAHHELTGRLPDRRSGPVRGVPGETWTAIDAALKAGTRTLPGRSSRSFWRRNTSSRTKGSGSVSQPAGSSPGPTPSAGAWAGGPRRSRRSWTRRAASAGASSISRSAKDIGGFTADRPWPGSSRRVAAIAGRPPAGAPEAHGAADDLLPDPGAVVPGEGPM